TQLIDTANAPIFGIDKKGNVNEWNQKAEEITGYSKEEVREKSFVDTYITDEYKESVNDVLTRALQGEETANYEVPIYSKYGVRIVVLLNATTRRNTKGEVIGVVGVGQDITEIDNLRKDLSISNARWQSIIKNEELAIIEVNLKLEIEFCSNIVKTAQHLFKKEDLIGQHIKAFFQAHEWDSIWSPQFKRLIKEGSYFVNQYDVKDGRKTITIQNQWFPHYESGKLVNIICISSDITEINEAKQELSSISRHFIQSQEASLTGSWEWDIQNDIIWWSDETYKIFEVEKDTFKNTYTNYLSLLNKESQKIVIKQVELILDNNEPYTHTVQLKHNDTKFIEGKGYLIKDEQGNNQKLIGVVKDITSEHKLEKQKNILDKQLRESQEKRQELYKKMIMTQEDERKRLARDVHDDLGQQLAYLKIKLELAKKEAINGLREVDRHSLEQCKSSSCKKSLIEVEESITQLQKAIQTTRIIAKELRPPQLDLLSLKDLIEDHILQLHHSNEIIECEINVKEKDISTTIKETIFRITKEGLENAIKHAKSKIITVKIKSNKKDLIIQIIDNGLGFKESDIIKPGSFGLIGIEEQLIPLNGAFLMTHQNNKTKLEVRIPI
ncbi:hypothetical protein CL658_02270, partial [bacterium]|nr:hypothetical protein [bacterium]